MSLWGEKAGVADFSQLLEFSDAHIDAQGLVRIASGFSSTVYGNDSHVVKLLRSTYPTERSAHQMADILYGEQDRLYDYLDPRTIKAAEIMVGKSTIDDHRILLVQSRICGGITMKQAVERGMGLSALETYLSSALAMHTATGVIPDLACLERGFSPMKDPNTQVVIEDHRALPVLVDTTQGKMQRNPHTKRFVNKRIAKGVEKALGTLN